MKNREFSTSIKKTPYKYLISKKIGLLIYQGLSYNEIYKKCYDENYIQIDSLQRRREITNVIYKRLIVLDETLLNFFLNDSMSTSKFILVYSIAKTDKLFFEFLLNVYRESILGDKSYIGINDFEIFFETAKEKHLEIINWKPITIKHLTLGYKQILLESGLCIKEGEKFYPQHIIVNPVVFNYIKENNEYVYLQAILGVK